MLWFQTSLPQICLSSKTNSILEVFGILVCYHSIRHFWFGILFLKSIRLCIFVILYFINTQVFIPLIFSTKILPKSVSRAINCVKSYSIPWISGDHHWLAVIYQPARQIVYYKLGKTFYNTFCKQFLKNKFFFSFIFHYNQDSTNSKILYKYDMVFLWTGCSSTATRILFLLKQITISYPITTLKISKINFVHG